MFKGTKKAIARTPHRITGGLTGAKTEDDEVVTAWTKDFATAEAALDAIEDDISKLISHWRDMAKHQREMASLFREIYNPIDEPNAYRMTQETPESTLLVVTQYGSEVVTSTDADVMPIVTSLETSVAKPCKEARKCIDSVRKALTKREHKKIDYDRFNSAFQKIQQKYSGRAASEKEAAEFIKHEEQVDAALEAFLSQDEKVKKYVPHVLNVLSELLNYLTAILYLNNLHVAEAHKEALSRFSVAEGFGKETASYDKVLDDWESRFTMVQPQVEQGLHTIEQGETIKHPMDKPYSRASDKAKNFAGKTLEKTWDTSTGIANTAYKFAKHPHVKPSIRRSETQFKFSSTEFGMFGAAADILSPDSDRMARSHRSRLSTTPSQHSSPTERDQSPNQYLLTHVRAFSSSSARALSPQSGASRNRESGSAPFVIPPPSDNDEYAVALYTFSGDEPGDVAFRVGERIRVLDHGDEVDDKWWFGQTNDGRLGLFPCNYVKIE